MDSRPLGDYKLIKQIGKGSLGTAYLAEHQFMKKHYVLKVLPEELATDRSFIQRFEEEIGILASLDHPHIVKVHNVSFDQGQYFLIMDCAVDELGETTNLAQFMMNRGRRLEENELLRLLRQVADALDYAHNKKIGNRSLVHRGLKLNNILVEYGSKQGHEEEVEGPNLKLSDFGLSRIIGVGAVLSRTYKNVAESLGINAPGLVSRNMSASYPVPPIEMHKLLPLHASFLQNYAFLAPEQKRLDHPYEVDSRADTYAFGILVYYLIMGESPEGIFMMPSKRVKDYKLNWDHIILSCLQSDPEKRPEFLTPLLDQLVKSHEGASGSSQFSTPVVGETQDHAFNSDNLIPIIHKPQIDRPYLDLDSSQREFRNLQPLLPEMVVIKGGAFYRGSNDGNRDEMPRHQITLSSFAIDIHPVTNEQFVRFLEVMGGEKDSGHNDIIRLRESRIKRSGGKLMIESGYNKHPVVGVTWYGAVAYAKWVGKRLPLEAEWEVAARGGVEHALFPTGDDIEKSQANFFSSDTTAVMSYPPNGCGLYDMAGNVYEWCHDWYGYNYYEISMQEPENPKGPIQGVYRVLKGGCWKSLKEDLRCSRRHRNNPGTVNGTYGFRCVADVH